MKRPWAAHLRELEFAVLDAARDFEREHHTPHPCPNPMMQQIAKDRLLEAVAAWTAAEAIRKRAGVR